MKKGFSLMVLAIVVAVMIVLVTATTIGVINAQKNVRVLTFATELSIIQDKVNLYYNKNNEYPITNSGSTININVGDVISQYSGEAIESNNVTLYYLDLGKIYENNGNITDDVNALNYGLQKDENDVYLISFTTGRVYYKKGVEGYYTLTNELKEKIGYVEQNKNNSINIGDIVFIKNNNEYTNQPIITTIKVPSTYQNISCKMYYQNSTGTEISMSNENQGYKVYNTPNNINSNYYVVVEYTDNGKQNSVNYNIDNYDNIVPTITIGEKKKSITNSINGESNIFYYIDYNDNSGIDEIKYAELKIEADVSNDTNNLNVIREYMKLYGKELDGKVLNINQGTRWITVYAKDKAGNESYIYKQVPEIEKNATSNIESSITENDDEENDPHDLVSNV